MAICKIDYHPSKKTSKQIQYPPGYFTISISQNFSLFQTRHAWGVLTPLQWEPSTKWNLLRFRDVCSSCDYTWKIQRKQVQWTRLRASKMNNSMLGGEKTCDLFQSLQLHNCILMQLERNMQISNISNKNNIIAMHSLWENSELCIAIHSH